MLKRLALLLERVVAWMSKHPKEMKLILEAVAAGFALTVLKATGLLDVLKGIFGVIFNLVKLDASTWVMGLAGAFAFLYSKTLDMGKLWDDLKKVVGAGVTGDFKGMRDAFSNVLLDMIPQWDRFVEYVQNTSWGKTATDWAENAMEVVFSPRSTANALKKKVEMGQMTQRAADSAWDDFVAQFNKEHTTLPISNPGSYELGTDYRRSLANAKLRQDAVDTRGYTPAAAKAAGLPFLGGADLSNILTQGLIGQQNISIGTITINTKATDAKAIAAEVPGALRQQLRNDRANTARPFEKGIKK